MGPTATGRCDDTLEFCGWRGPSAFVLEPLSDNGADAAAGNGAAQAGGAARAEGAGQGCAMETEEFVAVSGAPGVLSGAIKGARFHRVAAVLEPLDGALVVVDFQYPFDLTDRIVLL